MKKELKAKETKVLLVDDHQMFLQGLTALLQDIDEITLIDTLTNGEKALLLLEKQQVDVVIMDISMPGMDGIELNKIIKQKYPKIKTLVLSTHSDSQKISRLIKDDVNGYLLKNAETSELLKAIYSLVSGNNYFSEEVKEKYMRSTFSSKSETDQNLSRRELEILKLVAEGCSTQEISDQLFISQHTVNSHRKNLLSKLGLKNAVGLAKYALENGIV